MARFKTKKTRSILKVKKFKLYNLNEHQKSVLESFANEHRLLYNHLLAYARASWFSGQGVNFAELNQEYKKFKKENNLTISSKSAQNTSNGLQETIKAFYQLRKDKTNNAHFPKMFIGYKYFKSFVIDGNCGIGEFKLENGLLTLLNPGRVGKRSEKDLVSFNLGQYGQDITRKTVARLIFSRNRNNEYYVDITYNEEAPEQKLDNCNYMSIDIGTSSIATCYSNKINNLQIDNTRFFKLEKSIDAITSKRDKKKKYSKRWRRLNEIKKAKQVKVANKNKDFQHKVSRKIIDLCKANEINTLVVGDIKTKKLVTKYRHVRNTNNQNRGTLSRFKGFLKYKAINEGIIHVHVNEAYTSQTNCLTGQRNLSSELDVREVELLPGEWVDRDLNSAVNILKRYKGEYAAQIQELKILDKMHLNNRGNLVTKRDSLN